MSNNLNTEFLCFSKRFNIWRMYLHRFLRYTPLLGAIILFLVTLMKQIVFGPFSYLESRPSMLPNCEKWWWTTLLHVSNYVNPNEIVSFAFRLENKFIWTKLFQTLVPWPLLVLVGGLSTVSSYTIFDLSSMEIRLEVSVDVTNPDNFELSLHFRDVVGLQSMDRYQDRRRRELQLFHQTHLLSNTCENGSVVYRHDAWLYFVSKQRQEDSNQSNLERHRLDHQFDCFCRGYNGIADYVSASSDKRDNSSGQCVLLGVLSKQFCTGNSLDGFWLS